MHEVTAIKDSDELGSTQISKFQTKIPLGNVSNEKIMTPDTVDGNPAPPEIGFQPVVNHGMFATNLNW